MPIRSILMASLMLSGVSGHAQSLNPDLTAPIAFELATPDSNPPPVPKRSESLLRRNNYIIKMKAALELECKAADHQARKAQKRSRSLGALSGIATILGTVLGGPRLGFTAQGVFSGVSNLSSSNAGMLRDRLREQSARELQAIALRSSIFQLDSGLARSEAEFPPIVVHQLYEAGVRTCWASVAGDGSYYGGGGSQFGTPQYGPGSFGQPYPYTSGSSPPISYSNTSVSFQPQVDRSIPKELDHLADQPPNN